MDQRRARGEAAEALAARYLIERAHRIVARNARVGRLEIDIVAERDGEYAFCEVRSRRDGSILNPAETVDYFKQRRIRLAAREWMRKERIVGSMRFDVAAVTFEPLELLYYEGAF